MADEDLGTLHARNVIEPSIHDVGLADPMHVDEARPVRTVG
jgi:hypothetical protein